MMNDTIFIKKGLIREDLTCSCFCKSLLLLSFDESSNDMLFSYIEMFLQELVFYFLPYIPITLIC